MLKKRIILLNLAILIFTGCVSLIEKTGQFLDGTNEKILERYQSEEREIDIYKARNRNKEESVVIVLKKYPMLKLRGTLPDEDGFFYFTSMEYIAGNTQGWNEFFLGILGSGSFNTKEKITFSIIEKIEPVQITDGRIQFYNNRISGDEAVTALRNRRERILALIEWMASIDGQDGQNTGANIRTFPSLNIFKRYWEPVLLPELARKRNRPQNWRQQGDVYKWADSIRWNTSYTERVFPEALRPIRDSGTLLKDWEESLPWIYIEYEWDNIIELLSKEYNFQKIK